LAFARRFGPVEPPHPVFDRVAEAPEVTVVEQKGRQGIYNGEWHTDVTFLIEPLHAVHDITGGFMETWLARPDGVKAMQEAQRANPPVVHPVARTHPITGKRALFVNRSFTAAIQGLNRHEGQELLALLLRHAEQPTYQVRFTWRPKSLAIWDNPVTQHYAVADYGAEHRRMHRVTVIGDKPFFRA